MWNSTARRRQRRRPLPRFRCPVTRRRRRPNPPPLFPPSGNLWALLADATQAHRAILLCTYVSTGVLRYALPRARGYGQMLGLVLAMEAVGSPVQIIADACTMAAGDEARVGWVGGGRAGVAGWVADKRTPEPTTPQPLLSNPFPR